MSRIDYIGLEELKETLRLENTSFRDPDGEKAITAASRAIDDATNRYFGKSESDEERFYSPDRRLVLEIDDLIELTSIEVDRDGDGDFEESWTENTDFWLEPLNAAADGRPWERIVLDQRKCKLMPCRSRSVRVTGRFGWDEIPAGVVEFTGILATRLLKRATDAPFGIVVAALETASALRLVRTDPDAGTLLDGLTREVFLA